MIAKPKTKGQKIFIPTRAQRNQVCILVAAEWTLEMISADMELTKTCLKRFFPDELKNGAEQVRRRAVAALIEKGIKEGSVNALKATIGMFTEEKAPLDPENDKPQPKTPVLGKKQIQKIEAAEANEGVYATPKAPNANGPTKVQ